MKYSVLLHCYTFLSIYTINLLFKKTDCKLKLNRK